MCWDPIGTRGFPLFHCICEPPPPPVFVLSLTRPVWRGVRWGWRQKQTGVQVCDVWHAHTACVHHREETCLTAATPWPWLHYLLVCRWRSEESPQLASKTKHLWDRKCSEFRFTTHYMTILFRNVMFSSFGYRRTLYRERWHNVVFFVRPWTHFESSRIITLTKVSQLLSFLLTDRPSQLTW